MRGTAYRALRGSLYVSLRSSNKDCESFRQGPACGRVAMVRSLRSRFWIARLQVRVRVGQNDKIISVYCFNKTFSAALAAFSFSCVQLYLHCVSRVSLRQSDTITFTNLIEILLMANPGLLPALKSCRGDTRLMQLKMNERFVRTVDGYNLVN